jgi:hypothetical protein
MRLLPIRLLLSVPGELYQQSLDLQKGSLEGVYPLSKVVYSFVALVDSLRCSWTLPRFNSLLEMPEHQHDGQRENSHWAQMRPCRVARREEALRRGMRRSGKAVPVGGEMSRARRAGIRLDGG